MNMFTEPFLDACFDFLDFLREAHPVDNDDAILCGLTSYGHEYQDAYEVSPDQANLLALLAKVTLVKTWDFGNGEKLGSDRPLYPFGVLQAKDHYYAVVDDEFEKNFNDFCGKLETYMRATSDDDITPAEGCALRSLVEGH